MNAVAYFDRDNVFGTVRFHQPHPSAPVRVQIALKGFDPCQTHAIHIHEYGDLTQGCMSTGKHLNPSGDPHGSVYFTPKHRHAGDLINNLTTNTQGCVCIVFDDDRISLVGGKPECIVGRSVVIHRDADDYGLGGLLETHGLVVYEDMSFSTLQAMATVRGYKGLKTKKALVEKFVAESQTTGNAGGRMACAVIGWSAPEK
jgi:Cu-Zn family superoxide dismutase